MVTRAARIKNNTKIIHLDISAEFMNRLDATISKVYGPLAPRNTAVRDILECWVEKNNETKKEAK